MKLADGKEPLKDNEIADIISTLVKIAESTPPRQRRVVFSSMLVPILQNLNVTKTVESSKLDEFEARLKILEQQKGLEPWPWPLTTESAPALQKCNICGVDFSLMQHYVCNRYNCPNGGVTC